MRAVEAAAEVEAAAKVGAAAEAEVKEGTGGTGFSVIFFYFMHFACSSMLDGLCYVVCLQ